MLPPQLAHDELSLNEGRPRNAVTLWLELLDADDLSRIKVGNAWHERTVVVNHDATTYAKMGAALEGSPLCEARDLLRALSPILGRRRL